MGIRTTTLSPTAATLDPADWSRRLDALGLAFESAAEAGDEARMAELLGEPERWEDPHRRHALRKRLVEAALATPARGARRWQTAFVMALEPLMGHLERTPAEPVLLNYAGVMLYELGQAPAAQALFDAAARLDPRLVEARRNAAAARKRRKGAITDAPIGALGAAVAGLARRAAAVAAAARPAEGLTLSLCMIVKDEEEMLPGCLEAVRPFVDELIVVDTGSTDRTVEIAASFGARVLHFPWNGSFADARNVSLEAATGDWVMYLDADEHLVPEDGPMLRELLGRTWREGFELVETNYTRDEGAGQAVTHLALRIWRHRPQYRFEGAIHEQKTRNMPTYLRERFEQTGIRVRHYGYLQGRIEDRDKSRRNLELLEREAGERPTPFMAFNLGSEHLALDEPATARRLLDAAWAELRKGDWTEVGYAAPLVARAARARRAAGDPAGARVAIAEGLAGLPDHTDLVFELALCARDQGELAEAARLAERCLAMGDAPARYHATVGTGGALALTLLGQLHEISGEPAAAEARYRRALAEHPDYVAPALPLAALMAARGAGADEVEAALPDRPSAFAHAAAAYAAAGRPDVAERWYRVVLARQPRNDAARAGIVEALLAQRRYGEAADAAAGVDDAIGVELFARAAANDAAGLAAALARAEAAGIAEHERAVYAAWAAAIAGGPAPALPLPAALSVAAGLETFLRLQDFDNFAVLHGLWERVELAERERRELMARIYLRQGFLESAADEWIAVAAVAPDARALVGLAQVAAARGLDEDALALAGDALALEPGNADAARILTGVGARVAVAAAG
jgi:hypothetical protein